MFHAQMGRFQLELVYYFAYFSTVVSSNSCLFLSCRVFVVNTTFRTGLGWKMAQGIFFREKNSGEVFLTYLKGGQGV